MHFHFHFGLYIFIIEFISFFRWFKVIMLLWMTGSSCCWRRCRCSSRFTFLCLVQRSSKLLAASDENPTKISPKTDDVVAHALRQTYTFYTWLYLFHQLSHITNTKVLEHPFTHIFSLLLSHFSFIQSFSCSLWLCMSGFIYEKLTAKLVSFFLNTFIYHHFQFGVSFVLASRFARNSCLKHWIDSNVLLSRGQ